MVPKNFRKYARGSHLPGAEISRAIDWMRIYPRNGAGSPMKQIAVVTQTRKTRLGEALRQNLEEVLGDRAEIRIHALDELAPGEPIEADVVLAMARSKVLELRSHVPEPRRILLVHRTIRESKIYDIFAIPPGARVLVVNDTPETTLETVALLQQLEINHLQYVPFEPGMDCGDIRIAITPGEPSRVPRQIGTVIDLDHRCIDISTFVELIDRLGIADREVDRRLLRYSEGIVTLDGGVNRQSKELFQRNTELDAVINLSHEGVLLLSTEGKVRLCNRALAGMLGLSGDLRGATMKVFPPGIQEVLLRKTGREWIVDHKGRSLVITRQPIEHFGEPAGTCYNVQEVTYIRQLEQNLSQKLRAKGLAARYSFSDVLTRSPRMEHCVDMARRIAKSDFTVLIMGESGTGKELLAQSIHRESARGKQPFVAVNCAAVPEALLESELFGYEGGSFTGALKEGKPGLFVQANHGTVFLDEIADMPLMLQAKLLRVPGRDRGHAPDAPGQAAACPPGAAGEAHRLREGGEREPAGHRRHPPRPAGAHPPGALPGGPLLPPQHPASHGAAPAGPGRGCLPPAGALPRRPGPPEPRLRRREP